MHARPRTPTGRGLLGSPLAWLSLAVTILFGYLAVRNVDFGRVGDSLAASNGWWIAASLAALAPAVLLRALRWRAMFVPSTRPPTGAVVRSLLIGYFFNNVLPARAGEAARIFALNQQSGASRMETLGTVVLERLFDVLALLLLLFAAAPFLPEVSWLHRAAYLGAVLALALVVGIVVLARYGDRPLRFVLRPLSRLPRISPERAGRAGSNLGQGLAGLRRPRLALTAFVLTTASWLALVGSAWLLFFALDLELGFGAALLAVVATNLAQILPSSPGAIGVFEAATLLALGAYGIDDSEALSYAILFHAVNLFPYLAIGAVVVHRHAGVWQAARAVGRDPRGE